MSFFVAQQFWVRFRKMKNSLENAYIKNIYVRVNNRKYETKFDKCRMLLNKLLKKITMEECSNETIIILPSNYEKNKVKIKKQIEKFFNKFDGKNKNIVYANEIEECLKWKNGLTNINRQVLNENNVTSNYRLYL